jgi:hypothetical protein
MQKFLTYFSIKVCMVSSLSLFYAFDINAQNSGLDQKLESYFSIDLAKGCKNNKPRLMEDYNRALLQAKLSVLDQRFASETADKVRDFNNNKDKFVQALDQIFINPQVASTCKNKKLTINYRSSLNESLLSTLLIGENTDQVSGPRSRVSAIFLARRQDSVLTYRDREISASKAGGSLDAVVKDEVTESGTAYAETSSQQQYSESGGSVLKRADKILWNVSTSIELDAAVSQTFSSFGYRFIDLAQVEAMSNGVLSIEQFKAEFGTGNDLSGKTKNSVFAALKENIPIFIIATIDVGVAKQNPVTSETIVYVSVTAKAYQYDGLFYATVASVEPQQFSASGPDQTVAETRALVKASRSASEEVVRQLYAAKIY